MVTVKYSAEIDEISMINSSLEPIERTFDCFSMKKVRSALSKIKLKGKIIPGECRFIKSSIMKISGFRFLNFEDVTNNQKKNHSYRF